MSLRQAWLRIAASTLVTLALLVGCNAPVRLPTPSSSIVTATQIARQPTPTPAPTPRGQRAQVTHIVDGDTIYVTFGGATHRVRYILINTPETDEPSGPAATAANQALVGGQTVYLVKDKSQTDRYGRLLRYVYLPNGTFVNAELVRQGFAQVATYPPDVSKLAEIQAAEAEARLARRGLWAAGSAAFGPASAAARVRASLRRGPGLGYPVAGEVRAGQPLALVGQDAAGQWLQVTGGLWIMAALVTGAPTNLPVVGDGMDTSMAKVTIVDVNKQAEYVDLRNDETTPVDLAGWVLRSELGLQDCPLAGMLPPGATLRVWAQTGEGGFSCGFGSQIWSNSGVDPAVLLAPGGVEVGRRD